MAEVYVKKGKARPFWFRHPWVFSGAVDRVSGEVRDGDVVDVVDVDRSFIGRGLYNARSQIRVRVLSHDPDECIDPAFFRGRLERAAALREDTLDLAGRGTDGYRLVHGEGDGLSGVVIDRYRDHFVIQFSALGIKQRQDLFLDFLKERFQPASIYENTSFPYREAEGIGEESGVRYGDENIGEIPFSENGFELVANLSQGQKTGYYFDQRENRRLIETFAKGRTVLDAFCYTGGFGLHAARGGASKVVCVDSSATAIAAAEQNAERNGLRDRIEFIEADADKYLREAAQRGEHFDIVLVDPPKYAVAKKDLSNALHRYRELNTDALRVVKSGGLLATSSCSYHVSEPDFEGLVNEAAKHADRFVQTLLRAGQGADHPVSSACLEGRYLKFTLARVI